MKRLPRPADKIDPGEMRNALVRSGYLLEGRVASFLRKRDYRVQTNPSYPDPDSKRSREIDLYAQYMRVRQIGPSEDNMLWPEFVIECINPPQPVVFFAHGGADDFFSATPTTECARLLGMPLHVPASQPETNWQWLLGVVNATEDHHYSQGYVTTQFCSFELKKNQAEWMALHRDSDHETFRSLCYAADYFTIARYHSFGSEWTDASDLQIAALCPVLVIQGELYIARPAKKDVTLRQTGHVKYYRSIAFGQVTRDYMIDVVTESYFPQYLRKVELGLDRIADKIARQHQDVRGVLALHLEGHRRFQIANPGL